MILYLRCVWANLYTSFGYLMVLGTLLATAFTDVNIAQLIFYFAVFALGVGFLLVTEFGKGTLRAYRKTLMLLEKHDATGTKRLRCRDLSGLYCSEVGIQLAYKDFYKRESLN